MVQVKVNSVPLEMELDTGASVTIISEVTYRSTWPRDPPFLEQVKIKLKTYAGEELQVHGRLNAQVDYEGQTKELPILIVGGQGASLLGRNWLQELRLDWPKICCVRRTGTLDQILNKYAAVFREGLGELKVAQARIHVGPNVQPRFHRPRSVLFALRGKVEEELERLHCEGVLQPVQFSDWAAPIVPVVTSDGRIRICGATVSQSTRYPK